jgi:hypothetical protein
MAKREQELSFPSFFAGMICGIACAAVLILILTRAALLCLCGGIGFNIAQRLLDHFIDMAVEHETLVGVA